MKRIANLCSIPQTYGESASTLDLCKNTWIATYIRTCALIPDTASPKIGYLNIIENPVRGAVQHDTVTFCVLRGRAVLNRRIETVRG